MASGVFTQSFGIKTRRNEQISPEPSHPIYRRLRPRGSEIVIAYVSEELECEGRHASLYAGRTSDESDDSPSDNTGI